MKKLHIIIMSMLLAISIVSCKKTFNNLLNDPSKPTPASADVDLYVSQVQLNFNYFYQNVSDNGAALSRMQNWGGPLYQNAYLPTNYDGMWTEAYQQILNNADAMIPLADAQKKYVQAGLAEVLEAYTLGTLVDMFNNIPDSQSELGTANPNPKADAAATVYAHVQSLLDAAIVELGKTGGVTPTTDLFYGGSASNWIALANTLKLKFYMQTRLVDNTVAAKIQTLITANNLINTPAKDFQFQYGTNNSNPDARHPHYGLDYVASGGEGEYLSNYFMWTVASQKYGGVQDSILNDSVKKHPVTHGDPRLRYYFYREINNLNPFDATVAPCIVENIPSWYTGATSTPVYYPFCVVGTKGYYGRDHGDNEGAPPDNNYRTAWGVYPAGGLFDADQPTYNPTASDGSAITTLIEGGQGAGISPIWLSSYTDFLEAEAVLTLGVTSPGGDAPTLLKAGVTASISKVMTFPSTINVTVPSNFAPTSTEVSNYITLVSGNYTAATSTQAKLNIIMTEYYIALWGNGIEAYNNLRRTGMPLNIQPAVTTANPGFFMFSFLYPNEYEQENLNHQPQKTPGIGANHVFWDNNSDTFIK